MKNEINRKLKICGSKYTFSFLPQSFICNLAKAKNKEALDFTLKEIISTSFSDWKKERVSELKKYRHNLFVLNYLENNKEISEKSNFNNIKNMKYYKIFNEYLESKEFGLEISTLKKEKENDKYIINYIIIFFEIYNTKIKTYFWNLKKLRLEICLIFLIIELFKSKSFIYIYICKNKMKLIMTLILFCKKI